MCRSALKICALAQTSLTNEKTGGHQRWVPTCFLIRHYTWYRNLGDTLVFFHPTIYIACQIESFNYNVLCIFSICCNQYLLRCQSPPQGDRRRWLIVRDNSLVTIA